MEGSGGGRNFAPPTADKGAPALAPGSLRPLPFYPQRSPDGGEQTPGCRAQLTPARPRSSPTRSRLPSAAPGSPAGGRAGWRAPHRSAPAGRPPPPCPGAARRSCCSLPFCSLAPEKANLLLRSDSAAAPCLRPARADVSRSSPRRSIGPAGRGAPVLQALAARHRGPGVSQQRPARAAPLGRRQH